MLMDSLVFRHRWIAVGTSSGGVYVWDAKTYERAKVFSHSSFSGFGWDPKREIKAVDFSPDSTRLVSVSNCGTATIWDIATRNRVQTFGSLVQGVAAAKYSPQGDRIAVATDYSVGVWDSNDGRLLMKTQGGVAPLFNTGLLWSNNHLFVISNGKIKRFEASTGSADSEWPVPDTNSYSCIALPKDGIFIAYSTQRTVTFWDTATHTQLGLIQHSQDIHSIAFSPDDRFLAIGGEYGKIAIYSLPHIAVRILSLDIVVHMNSFLAPIIFPKDNQPASAQALREWANATLACGEWKDALLVAAKVSPMRSARAK